MIRENRSLPDDKPGAEEVGPHLRRAAFQRVDRIAVAVFQRLAVAGDAGVSQRSSRGMVKEYDRNVEQANARRVRANHLFRGLRFRFDPPQAIVGLLKLLAERRDFFASSARDFLPQLFCLVLELLLLSKYIGLLKIRAGAAGIRHQLLLAMRAALQLRNHPVRPSRLLVSPAGIQQENPGNEDSDREKH